MRVSRPLGFARKTFLDQISRVASRSANAKAFHDGRGLLGQSSSGCGGDLLVASSLSVFVSALRRFVAMSRVLDVLKCVDRTRSTALLNDFREGGADRLMVVADFDYTLSVRRGENGEKGCLTHQCFDASKIVEGSDTIGELQERMNTSYLQTYSACVNDEERSKVNIKWWNDSHNIIIRSKMHRDEIPTIVQSSKLIWRKSVRQVFEVLERHSVPLLIFSAGLSDIINEAIRQLLGHIPCNVITAANVMYFDKEGFVSRFTDPPLHSLAKNVPRLRELLPDVDDRFNGRTNVLLVGDTENDSVMVDGWGKHVLKVAFQDEKRPPLKTFDVLITQSDCVPLVDVINYICSTSQSQ